MTTLRGAGYDACPRCGGGMPGHVHDDLVCQCGRIWADPGAEAGVLDWQHLGTLLTIRSGAKCEIRSPECLAARWDGHLAALSSRDTSIHHRRPRGMGGTRRADVHSLAALINACGDGVRGCHGYVEAHAAWAEPRGFKVTNHGGDDGDILTRPIVLYSGRRVLLDPLAPYYQPAPGPPYDLDLRRTA
jgi:hypothetical protein